MNPSPSLGIIDGPQPTDLTTVAAVQAYMRDKPDAGAPVVDDDTLQLIVSGVSLYWLQRTGVGSLNSVVDYTEAYDGTGSDRLFLRNTPVLSVSSISVGGGGPMRQSPDGFQSGFVLDNSGKSVSYVGGGGGARAAYLRGTWGSGGAMAFPRGLQNVHVSYTAGYGFKEPAEPATIPNNPAGLSVVHADGWQRDLGVIFADGSGPLVIVGSAPAQGQYTASAGVYVFNPADYGRKVVIAYWWGSAPYDVQRAVTQQVAVNARRRKTIDLKSINLKEGGTTTYRDWAVPPEVEQVIVNYTRRAIIYG